MTDHAPRFRHLGGDRWEWTPQRVLDQRERQARLLDAMARSDMVSLRAQAALRSGALDTSLWTEGFVEWLTGNR